jgi:hypothetical protein
MTYHSRYKSKHIKWLETSTLTIVTQPQPIPSTFGVQHTSSRRCSSVGFSKSR